MFISTQSTGVPIGLSIFFLKFYFLRLHKVYIINLYDLLKIWSVCYDRKNPSTYHACISPLYHWNRYQRFGDIQIRKRDSMDTDDTKQDTSVEESNEIPPTEIRPPTLFLPHDVILEVEGIQLHVCRQVLAENSPEFERMFKSEFKEKDLTEIPLLGKKFKDIVEFLRSFYDPESIRPITGI